MSKQFYNSEARRESRRVKRSNFGVFKARKKLSGSFASKNK